MLYDSRGGTGDCCKLNAEKLKSYSFEIGPIRPPSEGQDRSLLLRVTRNCPWNRCQFCHTYKGKRFGYRSVAEIKGDIEAAAALSDEIKAASWMLGYGGRVGGEVVRMILRGNPEIYGEDCAEPEVLAARYHSLMNVSAWLSSGARTAFLQDANTLIMRTPELVEVIRYLRERLPSIERVTSYGRSKTAAKKNLEELKELHDSGLSRLHIGLESGCDEVLQEIQKGVTAEEHVTGGRKVVESGISLSEYVMPGLGGRRWSQRHALETAAVLNEINADYIRLRSLIVQKEAPLRARLESGDFEPLMEDEVVDEIGLFIENLSCKSYLVSDHMLNLLGEIEGQLPEDKEKMLGIIAEYKAMLPLERLKFKLERRLRPYLGVYGSVDEDLRGKLEEAFSCIQAESPDAESKVESVLSALREGFV
jgi:hypothetical protein